MHCTDVDECFHEISDYFEGERTGHFLLVNTNNYGTFQKIRERMGADQNKKCRYLSDYCQPDGFPDLDLAISQCISTNNCVMIGLAPALMFQSEEALKEKLDELAEQSISGYGVILLDHCDKFLRYMVRRDLRIERRVVLMTDEKYSKLPHITIINTQEESANVSSEQGFRNLMKRLERITDQDIAYNQEICVYTKLPMEIFGKSMYYVHPSEGIFGMLKKRYPDLAAMAIQEEYGTKEEWSWLYKQIKSYKSFSSFIYKKYGNTTNLSIFLPDVISGNDVNEKWLLWLAMKAFGESNNYYMTRVLQNSSSWEDLEYHIYLDLAEVDVSDPDFDRMYGERKRLLQHLPDNMTFCDKYCSRIGKYQKNQVFYLTDRTLEEKTTFMCSLSKYDYTEKELNEAVKSISDSLALYMQDFEFDRINTKLSETDADFRKELTDYFKAYKRQKLINHIDKDFLDTVNRYAVSNPRPYIKLQPRSSIISHIDKGEKQGSTKLFFFDALGVEYLSFIVAKCEEYGMISEISIGHCELPSITVMNKEFLQHFDNSDWYKIDDLDEMKHHSQIYNYQKCEYPIHLFEELEVIDRELRTIHSMLEQNKIERAIIVSDHGASRLAVLYGHEMDTTIPMDEPGEHSGRCCKAEEDPKLPFAAYENGFAVLANYDRFKGGRKANVEVHGGATLEEVVVPVIVLTKRPSKIEMCFTDPVIQFKPKVTPELVLYSNVPLQKPMLRIEGELIEGEFLEDKQHVRFLLPMIKRAGSYTANVFDGGKDLSVALSFSLKRRTGENKNMGI